MSRKPIQSVMLAAVAIMAMAEATHLDKARGNSRFTVPGGGWAGYHGGSPGMNMRMHNVKNALKRKRLNQIARASRKRNRQ